MLPNRRHLDWIDTRSKHITRQESLQTRSQEQLIIMISRVSAFGLHFAFGPLASAPPLRRYRYPHLFFQIRRWCPRQLMQVHRLVLHPRLRQIAGAR
jgi:hypothetical protein